ncbi:LicD family protein [Clostridium perfringens]|nr:LicD family protein [Clostridium perfringens]
MEASLKEAQELMTTILKDIDTICKKNNIDYWIESGTLLGAVRHKGFIPWDDDIDIGMLREDYNKFIEIASRELKDDIILCNFKNEKNVQYQWSKVKHKYSKIIEEGNTSENSGLFVDIFPYDFYSRKGNDFSSILKKTYKKKFAVLHYSGLDNKSIICNSDRIKKYICKILKKVFLNKTFNELCNEVVGKIPVKEREENDVLSYGIEVTAYDNYLEYEDIFPLKEINFENITVKSPNKKEKYLKNLYGENYMELPKHKDRVFHNNGIFILKKREG